MCKQNTWANNIAPIYKLQSSSRIYKKLTSSVCNIESRMLPIAVLVPTPTTTALALPATTTVPWWSKYARTYLLLKI